MSTGIISIAFHDLGVGIVARLLGVVTVVSFCLLILLFAIRIVRHPGRVATDLRDRERHWGWFALLVWTLTCLGMIRAVLARVFTDQSTLLNETDTV